MKHKDGPLYDEQGKPQDIALWQSALEDDTEDTFDAGDPAAVKRRLAQLKAEAEPEPTPVSPWRWS